MTRAFRQRRWTAPVALVAAASLVLVACGDDEDGGATGGEPTGGAEPTGGQFEFFSWWTGPGDSEGKEALLDLYRERHPEVEIVDATVAGGAGTNAQAVLASRLQAGDPPDSYQRHVGEELMPDIEAGLVEDLTWLYEDEGWMDALHPALLERVTVDGGIYSVPANVHRSNLIWYNPDVLDQAGISGPPANWDEFLQQAETLESRNITPLTIGPLWTQKHLLENVLLGELGAEGYSGLWDGSTDWESEQVISALDMFTQVLEHTNIGEAAADWQPALDPVIEGNAAYNVMGDWANTYFTTVQELEYQNGYDVAVSPGTEGIFNFLSDSFTLPNGADNRNNAIAWLRLAGSKEGQDTFNPIKGSIPARTDADPENYTGYLQMPFEAWNDPETEVVGSLAHGVVAGGAFNTDIDSALSNFVSSGNAQQFATAVKDAYEAGQ